MPPGTDLAPKPPGIQEWDDLTADEKKVFARYMEIYAAFAEVTDYRNRAVSRRDRGPRRNGQYANLLHHWRQRFGFPRRPNGAFNELSVFNGLPEPLEVALKNFDEIGGPKSHPLYNNGWAFAGATPFGWGHQVASYGGVCQSMVVHWPKGIAETGGLRTQWMHMIDIAPTVLEAVGVPEPAVVSGVQQKPLEGVSVLDTLNNAEAKSRHTLQYFEMAGNRGIYQDGWFATTVHRPPWEPKPRATFENDKWEFYNVEEDFSCAHDLAAKYPDKLEKLKGVFLEEAVKYNVLPLDDRAWERFNAALAGRPDLMEGRTEITVYEGMKGIPENGFINVKNRSFVVSGRHRGSEGWRRGSGYRPRRRDGRLESLRQGRRTPVCMELSRSRDLQDRRPRSFARQGGSHSASSLLSTVVWARAVTVRSSSMAKRSPEGGSSTRSRSHLARKRRTWARTSTRVSATITKWEIINSQARFTR